MEPTVSEQKTGRFMTDRELLARTAWGENRSGGREGMQSVINVIMNRVGADFNNDKRPDWWGEGIAGVTLKSAQFSAWNVGDPNRQKMLDVTEDDPEYRIALELADQALTFGLPDITNGGTQYHHANIRPFWVDALEDRKSAFVSPHIFYAYYGDN